MRHKLKIEKPFFEHILSGIKTFEIRKNDRGYTVDDSLILQEYFPKTDTYSGRVIWADVCYISGDNQQPGWLVLGLFNIELMNSNDDEKQEAT